MKKHIPNIITTLNLYAGFLSVLLSYTSLHYAAFFIIIATVFDFFDGYLAKKLNAVSEIGKQLDSLADMVSFGLAPSIIMYHLLLNGNSEDINFPLSYLLSAFAFIILVCSAYRLARFNTQPPSIYFKGLPTPASALFISSLPFLINTYYWLANSYILLSILILLGFLMISPLRLISLKFENYSLQKNKLRYLFVFVSIILLFLLKFLAIPIIILLYILISVIHNLKKIVI